jgi:hypothetical protein
VTHGESMVDHKVMPSASSPVARSAASAAGVWRSAPKESAENNVDELSS